MAVEPQEDRNPTVRELYAQGRTAQLRGDVYRAVELYKLALAKNVNYIEALVGLSEAFFELGEYGEALNHVQSSLLLDRSNPDLLNLEGRTLIGLGRFEEARERFQEAIELEPNNLDAQFGLAELDVAYGRTGSAEERYQEALQTSPQNRRALLSLVLLAHERGDDRKAEDYVERVLRYHPDNPHVRYLAGIHFLRQGSLLDAQYHTEVSLSLAPDSVDSTLLLAQIHLSRGDYLTAAGLIDDILDAHQDNHILRYTLAMAWAKIGEVDLAINALEKAFRLQSDDEIARIALEHLVRDELPFRDPRRSRYAEFHIELGKEYEDRNLLDRARREYRRGLFVDPYSREARLLYAGIYETFGFNAEYLEQLKVAAADFDDPEIMDKIEIQESLTYDSVSREWEVDQYHPDMDRVGYVIGLYLQDSQITDLADSQEIHFLGDQELSRYFAHLLLRYLHISIEDWDQTAPRVDSFAEAFAGARGSGTDFFVMFRVEESKRHFRASCDLYSSLTGTLLRSYSVLRTGNKRISDALFLLADDLAADLPRSGKIVKRKFDEALINLGSRDGVEPGDELLIVPRESVEPMRDEIGFEYPKDSVVGKLVVDSVDELVAVGTIDRHLFFDLINIGDRVLYPPGEDEDSNETGDFSPLDLYRSILRIR